MVWVTWAIRTWGRNTLSFLQMPTQKPFLAPLVLLGCLLPLNPETFCQCLSLDTSLSSRWWKGSQPTPCSHPHLGAPRRWDPRLLSFTLSALPAQGLTLRFSINMSSTCLKAQYKQEPRHNEVSSVISEEWLCACTLSLHPPSLHYH